MADRDNDFLARWSRRKAEARRGLHRKEEDAEATPAPEQPAETGESAAGDESRVRGEARAQPGAPAADESAGAEGEADASQFEDFDFDSLDYNSDYTRFMEKSVPEAVRRRALRMLWQSDPVLANIDGLNDYDEDFTDAAMAVKGVLQSAYRPGKGYDSDEEVAEREKQRLAARDDEAQEPEAEGGETAQARDDGEAVSDEDDEKEDGGAGADVADAETGGDAPEADDDTGSTGRHEKA
jgi:hypothetical protein